MPPLAALLLLGLAALPGARAAARTGTPPAREPRLLASQCRRCHGEVLASDLARKVVHAPFADETGCGTCHRAHRRKGDAPSLALPREKLCVSCHRGDLAKPHCALAVDGSRCLSCHAPHASSAPGLLREVVHPGTRACVTCHAPRPDAPFALGEGLPRLCLRCHVRVEKELALASTHPPASDGECTSCHLPHAGDRTRLLPEARPALCLRCHPELAGKVAVAGHRAVKEGRCGECHAPHGSSAPRLLPVEAAALCLRCHEEARAWSTATHEPVRTGRCSACHDAHGGGRSLLARRGIALCAGCHEPLAKRLRAVKGVHRPAKDGACSACHDPHAGAAPGRLVRAGAALCGGCHDLAAARFTSRHAPALAKGTACTGCHDPHASPDARLLARRGPPLCAGCHEGEGWSRHHRRYVLAGPCPSCHETAHARRTL